MYKNKNEKLLEPVIYDYGMRLSYKIYKCKEEDDIWDFSCCHFSKMKILKNQGRVYMFKMNGHTITLGTGNQGYLEPRYYVGILSNDGTTYYTCFKIIYDRGTAKMAKNVAEEKYSLLVEKELSKAS